MSLALSIEKKKAEKARIFLLDQGLLDREKRLEKKGNNILFPLQKEPSAAQQAKLKKIGSFSITKASFRKSKKKPSSLEEALEGELTKAELSGLVKSFDIVGKAALLLIPDNLLPKQKTIAKALLEANPQVKTVARILGGHEGEFRVRPVKVIAGEKNLDTLHKEWECRFRVKLGQVFFSPRLSHERSRISALIKKGESVAVFFSGVGPFAIIFAKHSKAGKIYAVELNPQAAALAEENIKLNKVQEKVQAFEGDVKKVVPAKLKGKCDRVVMPLPKGGEDFLNEAFLALKPEGGVLHFYQFVEKGDLYSEPIKLLRLTAEKFNRSVEVQKKKVVRSFSPNRVQVVVDAVVLPSRPKEGR